jgi:hypothetical protein
LKEAGREEIGQRGLIVMSAMMMARCLGHSVTEFGEPI